MTSRFIWRSASLISALAAVGCGGARPRTAPPPPATLVLFGGDVRTMDPDHPHATAIAIAGERIVAVGDDAEIRRRIGPGTRAIDLHGKSVTPGLVDAHCHLYGLGTSLDAVALRGLDSEAAVVEAVAAAAKTRPATEWLEGRGWDQNRWPGQKFPTKASLDAIADRPVALRRIDGHALWVNTRALAAANITRDTPDPHGGKIVRDDAGAPTGVLIDNATDLVDRVIPPPTPEVRERRILAAAKLAVAAGLTGVHEMGIEDATAKVYERLARDGALPLRVYAYLAGDPGYLDRVRVAPGPAVGWFAMRGVKFFADGALGSRGARLYSDYDDDPGNRGLWVTEPEQLTAAVDAAVSGGWQTAVHAIGDAAVGSVIDAYLRAVRKHGGDRRLRIEHVQVITPDDVDRMVEAKAIASMQPTHATSDMPWAVKRIGRERIRGAYAWRTMLDHGIPLAAGSDFPIEEVSPVLGLYAAVTRQNAAGEPAGGWYPEQRLTLDEAIAGFTRGAAYAELAEDHRGMIAVGYDADLTVFDRVLVADRSLLDAGVRLTIVGGRVVYEEH